MGRRGPKPDPAAIREQKAPVRSRHAPKHAATADAIPVAASGGPPAWLKKDGLEIWKRLAPALRAAKLLSDVDAPAFGRYCRNYARWLKMQREMDKIGETYETEGQFGKMKRISPAFMIADRVERMLLAFEDRFGLNPAERQRIMAARANTGATGDMFGNAGKDAERREGDPAAASAPAAEPIEGPIGLLN